MDRRLAEAGVRGLKPARERLLTEADVATLLAFLDQRATRLAPRTPPGTPVAVRRSLHLSETKRSLGRVQRPAEKIALARGEKEPGHGR